MAGNNRRAGRTEEVRDMIRSDGRLGGYELPEGALPDGEEWHPITVRWWNHWRSSPQSARMVSEPDWDFLLDTALIHHNMWKNGRWEFANEVRMRVAQFGATPAARRALKQEIEVIEETPVGNAKSSNVTSIDDRRQRIAGA